LTNREITHDSVVKKAPLTLLPFLWKGRGDNVLIIFLLSSVRGRPEVTIPVEKVVF